MSYQERKAIVSFASQILILAVYSLVMAPRFPAGDPYAPEVFRYWGSFLLILVPVTIVASIIIHILFTIINTASSDEHEPRVTDERDRLIELKSTRNAMFGFTAGFLLAMASLVLGQTPSVMFIILIGAGVLSSAISDASEFYFYRRGY